MYMPKVLIHPDFGTLELFWDMAFMSGLENSYSCYIANHCKPLQQTFTFPCLLHNVSDCTHLMAHVSAFLSSTPHGLNELR